MNPPAYYGLVSNVPGRTPDLVIVPQPGVVYASPTSKKISEHGGLMMSDENVALLVNAPNLSPGSAGSTYSNYVRPCFKHFCCSACAEIVAGIQPICELMTVDKKGALLVTAC